MKTSATLTTGEILPLLNADGSFNRRGIMLLAHANRRAAKAQGFTPCWRADLGKAWQTAFAFQTYNAAIIARNVLAA